VAELALSFEYTHIKIVNEVLKYGLKFVKTKFFTVGFFRTTIFMEKILFTCFSEIFGLFRPRIFRAFV
jgi:hypothetical protein